MTLLTVTDLSKRFHIHHLEREVAAFGELSFTLRGGEFKRVSGANGAGKSSLLRCLYRSALPTGGRAIYASLRGEIDLARAHDADIALLRREEIGYVSQFLRPRPRTSALRLVAEGLGTAGVGAAGLNTAGLNTDEAVDAAQELLSELGLRRELWPAYPSTFSGGEQQKVNLARALVRPQRLLLLDEPTASLDAQARTALSRRLKTLKEQGVALLGVFHHPGDVAGLIDGEIRVSAPSSVQAQEVTD
ncbi:ATP-binding cassette domain-containing protein [Deinococcus sp.]|uniref:ATP-binding cassette domain-containing protein n=1 Tax=Deinococcus sp. TaxID=47478 RepID=UPI0025CE9A62|nr:ATP-binding cassette domain-containing protein [Deinococcus sp.]